MQAAPLLYGFTIYPALKLQLHVLLIEL